MSAVFDKLLGKILLHDHTTELDTRYVEEAELLVTSSGATDSGKPIKLDDEGNVDASMINDSDIDHGNLAGVGASDHHTKYALTDDLASGEITQIQNIDSVTVNNTQWGYLGGLNQELSTTDTPTFYGGEFSTDYDSDWQYNTKVVVQRDFTKAFSVLNDTTEKAILYGNGDLRIDKIQAISSNGLALYEDGGSGIFIKDGGYVGIGTSSPNTPLEINGDVKSNGLLWASSGASGSLRVARYENYDDSASNNGVDFGAKLGGSEFMVFKWEQESAWTSSSADADKDVSLVFGGLQNNAQTYPIKVESSGNMSIGHTSPDTILDINGAFTFREKSADPAAPDEGSAVMWMSDGTGTGDDGDVLLKITAGGSTKTTTLADFSEL